MNRPQKHTLRRWFSFVGLLAASGVLIGLLSLPSIDAATQSFTQARQKRITSGTVDSLAFTNPNTAGNLIIVYVAWNNTGSVGLSDTAGNTYTSVAPPTSWGSSNSWRSQVFYAKNISGGTNTVTARFGTAITSFGNLYIHEYSGLDRTNPLDASAASIGTTKAMSSGPATTTNGNDLIFGAGSSSSSVTGSGTGFTSRLAANGSRTEDKNVTSVGSYQATATQNGARWVMQLAAFKADSSDTTPPTTPTGLSGTAASSSRIDLSWAASSDDMGVAGYKVFRNGTQVATTTATSYQDIGLSEASSYDYTVSAYDAAGNTSAQSAGVSATTLDVTAPTTPANLAAQVLSSTQVDLSWSASSDNVGVTGYKLFRDGTLAATINGTTYQDSGLTPGTSYDYTVLAKDAAGNESAQSAVVTASTPQTSAELTYNPGLEQGGAVPDGWSLAGWGDASVNAGVTSDAHTGNRAYSISLAGRTQGDYKLLPTEAQAPAVQPGQVYHLSVWYRSSSASNALTIFAHTASGWGYYTDLSTLPAAASWTKTSVDTPPIDAGIDAIAWGVSLAGDGTLVTDDYSTTLADTTPPPTSGPAEEGSWTVLDHQMPIRAMHATLLDNGKVLLIAGSGNDADQFAAGTFQASVWDPATDTYHTIPVPKDMFCSGHVTLPDGRVLIQGGTKSYPTTAEADYGGLRDSYIFDPNTETFTKVSDANEGHWYPTLTELGNGDVWMGGGLKEDTSGAVNTEYWSNASQGWLPTGQVPQTWSFWGLYPHMFLMSDGRLFYSGGHVFGNGLPGTGASIYDWRTASITDVPGLRDKDLRDQSASVLLPPAQDQRVMIAGGGNINTNTAAIAYCDLIDLKDPQPAYQPGPDLPGMGKMYLNATILPDRTVLTTNGGRFNRDNSANVNTAAIFDPATNTWRSVAADPIGRNYHSSAVLLPDGRVAVFGSNPGDGSYELRVSVYKPPYMFKGTRPQISGVPAQAGYGSQFSFGVQTQDTIRWAQLMRPMSSTHQMDSNMRLVDLPITVANGVATVSMPTNPNLLPPGPYMLNVTDSQGVPSESAWVMIR